MARNLYALLVGINTYPDPAYNLQGCINDITTFEVYLKGRATSGDFNPPKLKVLKDEEATKEDIINGFRTHLSQATQDDVALFYFSGHGSQEQAPEAFWHLEPDRVNETLVCYDSREPGGWDLADKELSQLIAEVAQKGPHIVIIIDSCHSGSSTRKVLEGAKKRRIPDDDHPRPPESYLASPTELVGLYRGEPDEAGAWLRLPEGKHVLLAACQPHELSWEVWDHEERKHCGAFSYFMRQVLSEASSPLSYHDLMIRTRIRLVTALNGGQRPQLEVRHAQEANELFLNGAVRERGAYQVYHDADEGWTLDAGAVHGIPLRQGSETTHLALFEAQATPEVLGNLEPAVAEASVQKVDAQKSRLAVTPKDQNTLETTAFYQAVITGMPLEPLSVSFKGDEAGIAVLRDVLANCEPSGGPSPFIKEVATQPRYRVLAKGEHYRIVGPIEDRSLISTSAGYTLEQAQQVGKWLKHIARWTRTVDLANPATKLPQDAVILTFHYEGESVVDSDLTVQYREDGSRPTFRLELLNTTASPLYCALLGLYDDFEIHPLFTEESVRLEPGLAFPVTVEGDPNIPAYIEEDAWRAGATEKHDIVKLIVSTDAFDARLLQQGPLKEPQQHRGQVNVRTTLEQLMNYVQTRKIGGGVQHYSDWTTKEVTLTVLRPQRSGGV